VLLNTPALYVPQSFCVHEAQSALMLGHRRQGKAVNNFKPIPHSCPTLQAGQRAIVGLTLLPHIAGRARQAMNDLKPIPHSCPTLQAGQGKQLTISNPFHTPAPHRRQGKASNERFQTHSTLLPHIAGRARQAMNDFKPIPHSCPTLQAGQGKHLTISNPFHTPAPHCRQGKASNERFQTHSTLLPHIAGRAASNQ